MSETTTTTTTTTPLSKGKPKKKKKKKMPKGPFTSSVGVGRAEPEWARLNEVTGLCGRDEMCLSGETTEAPMVLSEAMMSGECGTVNVPTGGGFDLLIVGAGLSGAVIAERCSKELNMTSLIVEKRNHIGGNCYDFVGDEGIRCSKYGAHLFHTKFQRVWEYVQNFSEWMPFDHRVKGRVEDQNKELKLVPIPPTRETVNALFNANVNTDEEMQKWYDEQRVVPKSADGQPRNGEEAALSRVGPLLYEAVFKHYTKKQWDKYPEELDASVLLRLPCRITSDDRYFSDPWQALPRRGYTRIFENMLLNDKNIQIRLNCDFFELKKANALPKHKLVVFTGQIDAYYASLGMPKLEYRSLEFENTYVEDPEDGYFQEAMVVNYPSSSVPFTRIVEYKHTPNQPSEQPLPRGTLIAKEYSTDVGEPYYPVPNPENRSLYEKYAALAAKEKGVCFVGRLASYKYFNMDQAILNALEMYDNMKENGTLEPKRRPEDFGPGDGPK